MARKPDHEIRRGLIVARIWQSARGSRKHYTLTVVRLFRNGEKMKATGISGWNVKGKAVVEHWYGSDGSISTVRYPLAKMKSDAWEGTHRLVEADGTERKGKCRLQKGKDQWIFTAEWEEDGKKVTSKNVTRKVKD